MDGVWVSLVVQTGEIFEKAKEEKRTSFKLAYQVLTNLQEELLKLDGSVAETKSKYDASRKSYIKKRDAKKAKVNPADLKKAESSWQFCRQEYLLECAAANQHYLRFRNEQLPEVMDVRWQHALAVWACSCRFPMPLVGERVLARHGRSVALH